MFGFGKSNIFLGVDVGVASIKIVEIKLVDNKPYLSNYAWAKRPVSNDELHQQMNSFDAETIKCLKDVLRLGDFKSNSAHVAIPAFGGMVALIEFPEMNKNDLDQAIKFEAHKYIPTSLEETALSWEIVGRRESAEAIVKKSDFLVEGNEKDASATEKPAPVVNDVKMQVLLVAAPKKKVLSYEELIKNSGLTLDSIEIESFSLVRALIGNDPGNFLIIDIGGRICNMILAEKGIIKVNRNIDAGGRDITKTIAHSMGIDEARAKNIKISKENLLNAGSSIHFPTFEIIANEAKRVLEAYYKNEGNKKIDGVILSGGTAGMTGIADYFTEALGIKAVIGNPFGRINYDKVLEPKLKESGTRFSVSIGLALKGVDIYLKK